jgi:lipopolysaccharide/colanic/teichoic acid biosynthesis glycosyltransferase
LTRGADRSARVGGIAPWQRPIKRAIDVVGACVALTLSAPVALWIVWRIKRDSPGPVLFRQTRLGENMREFTVLKFRTMEMEVDDSVHRDYIRAAMNGSASRSGNGLYKLEREDSITAFGQWLRRTSLDEIPQFLNVLRGEMSLVGPRPCIQYEIEHFEPHHFERFSVPAGITGFWQVTLRAQASFREAVELDVQYVRTFSLLLDLRILLRTPGQVIRAGGTA